MYLGFRASVELDYSAALQACVLLFFFGVRSRIVDFFVLDDMSHPHQRV